MRPATPFRLLALGLALAGSPASAQKLDAVPGVNLGGGVLAYKQAENPYANLIRGGGQFNGWARVPAGGAPGSFRPDGWPAAVTAKTGPTMLKFGLEAVLPAGEYIVRGKGKGGAWLRGGFNGQGVVTLTFDGTGKTQVVKWPKAGPPADGTLFLEIFDSKAEDPVRDVEIILPGHDGKYWNDAYLADLAPFAAFRAIDWLVTSSNDFREWDRRPAPRMTVHQQGRINEQELIDLCNVAGKDLWYNIPTLASEDYVRKAAAEIDAKLKPGLKVYVEYSNEVWNDAMPQWKHHAAERAKPGLNPDNLGMWEWIAREDGKRTNLFKASLSPERKCTIVLARQLGYYETINNAIARYKEKGYKFDALAATAYFNHQQPGATEGAVDPMVLGRLYNSANKPFADALAAFKAAPEADKPAAQAKLDEVTAARAAARNAALDQLFVSVRAALREYNGPEGVTRNGKHTPGYMLTWKARADKEGVPLLFYEGGQHLFEPYRPEIAPLFLAAQRDARMYEAYKANIASIPPGCGILMHYWSAGSFGQGGAWGLKEYTGQPIEQAPKYRAMVEAIPDATPPPPPKPGTYRLEGPAEVVSGTPTGPIRITLDQAAPPLAKVTIDAPGTAEGRLEFTVAAARPTEFTVTPAIVSGPLSLTATNDAGLKDPAPLAIVVKAAEPPPPPALDEVHASTLKLLQALGYGGAVKVGADGAYTATIPQAEAPGYRIVPLVPAPK